MESQLTLKRGNNLSRYKGDYSIEGRSQMMNTHTEETLSEAKDLFIEGHYSQAEPILNQLLLQQPKNPEIYQMLATIYYSVGQFNKAIKTFKKALEIDPHFTDASVGLSIILNDLGRYDEGKKVFIEAQSLLDQRRGSSEPFIEEKFAAKHEELADLYFQYKRYNEAVAELLKALELSQRKADLTIRLSEFYLQMGSKDKAIRDLRRLILDQPDCHTARVKLGLIFYNNNNIAEAVEQWEAVLVREPRHGEALKYLKMAQAAGITAMDL